MTASDDLKQFAAIASEAGVSVWLVVEFVRGGSAEWFGQHQDVADRIRVAVEKAQRKP